MDPPVTLKEHPVDGGDDDSIVWSCGDSVVWPSDDSIHIREQEGEGQGCVVPSELNNAEPRGFLLECPSDSEGGSGIDSVCPPDSPEGIEEEGPKARTNSNSNLHTAITQEDAPADVMIEETEPVRLGDCGLSGGPDPAGKDQTRDYGVAATAKHDSRAYAATPRQARDCGSPSVEEDHAPTGNLTPTTTTPLEPPGRKEAARNRLLLPAEEHLSDLDDDDDDQHDLDRSSSSHRSRVSVHGNPSLVGAMNGGNGCGDGESSPSSSSNTTKREPPGTRIAAVASPALVVSEHLRSDIDVEIVMLSTGRRHLFRNVSMEDDGATLGSLKARIREELFGGKGKKELQIHLYMYRSSAKSSSKSHGSNPPINYDLQKDFCGFGDDDSRALNRIFYFYRRDLPAGCPRRVYLATSLSIYIGVIRKPVGGGGSPALHNEETTTNDVFPLVGTELTIRLPESTMMQVSTIKDKILQQANLPPHFKERTHLVWLNKNVDSREEISWEDLQHQDLHTLKTTLCQDGPLLNVWFDQWTIHIRSITTMGHCNIQTLRVLVNPTDTIQELGTKIRSKISSSDLTDGFVAFGGRKFPLYCVRRQGYSNDHETLASLGMADGCTVYLGHGRYDSHPREESQRVTRIPEPEFRGISLVQLRKVATAIVLRCQSEGWRRATAGRTDDEAKLLTPDEVNFLDLIEHCIIPTTETHDCSYAELIPSFVNVQPQIFCSHWVGGSVLECLAALEQQAFDRNYSAYTTYWIDAFALNHHHRNRSGALSNKDEEEQERQTRGAALRQSTKGAIVVLDKDLVCFRQPSSVFESHLALAEIKQKEGDDYKYDIYATATDSDGIHRAVGLTDGGGVVADTRPKDHNGKLLLLKPREERQSTLARSSRLSKFPLELAREALGIQFERPEDDNSQAYEETFAMIRARFAESIYRSALGQANEDMEPYRRALSCSPAVQMAFTFSGCSQFLGESQRFLRALPPTLQRLDLDMTGLKFRSSDEFAVGLGRLQNVQHVGLKMGSSRASTGGLIVKYGHAQGLTSLECLGKELSSLPQLTSLVLSCTECCESPDLIGTFAAGLASGNASLEKLQIFKLMIAPVCSNPSDGSLDDINAVLKFMPALAELCLDLTDNAKLLPLSDGTEWAELTQLRKFDLQFLGCPAGAPVESLLGALRSSSEMSSLRLNFGVDVGSAMGATPPKSTKIGGLGDCIANMALLKELDLNFEGMLLADMQEDFLCPLGSASFPCLEALRLVVSYHQTFPGIRGVSHKQMPRLKRLELGLTERGLWVDEDGCMGARTDEPVDLCLAELAEGFRTMSSRRQFDSVILRAHSARLFSGASWRSVKNLCKALVERDFVVGQFEFKVRSENWISPKIYKTSIRGLRSSASSD